MASGGRLGPGPPAGTAGLRPGPPRPGLGPPPRSSESQERRSPKSRHVVSLSPQVGGQRPSLRATRRRPKPLPQKHGIAAA